MAKHIEGIEQETVEIRVRLGRAALERLSSAWVACTKVFLTEQPDGTYALGVTNAEAPELLARKVELDDRDARFPNYDGGFDGPA